MSGNGSINLDGVSLSFSPSPDWFGSASVNVSVSDGEYTVDQTFSIEVNAVNDAPLVEDANVSLDVKNVFYWDV